MTNIYSNDNKFKVIVTDHAWPYNKLRSDATPEENRASGFLNYDAMSIDTMVKMKPFVDKLADKDCLLFAWGTWPFLAECMLVHEAWGFNYVTGAFVWTKTNKLPAHKGIVAIYDRWLKGNITAKDAAQISNDNAYFGMGRWTASNTEYCLLFKRGKPAFREVLFSQLITFAGRQYEINDNSTPFTIVHPVMGHSKKPEEVQSRIEQMAKGPYLELFATRTRNNWYTLGNQVTGNDIFDDMQELIDTNLYRVKEGAA